MNHQRVLPILQWLGHYESSWLRFDVLAGITLAAYAIPVSLAYASLAGLPPQMGLYCYLAGGIGYLLFGTSRQLAIGPTSAISLLLGVSLLELSAGDQSKLVELASQTAIVMAGVFVVAWLFRLSVLVNFISESILTGFKAGAALVIATTQLPKLLGVQGGGDDFGERIWILVQQLSALHWPTLLLGLTALALLAAGDKLLPGKPIALGVVMLAILVATFGQLEQQGVKVVGDIPAGLPELQPSIFDLSGLRPSVGKQLVRLACACFLLSYIESVSAARTFALAHKYEIDSRQELLGLGAASLLAGLFQGYPIAGGLSQSAVNERSGAKTPLSLFFASLTLGIVLLFLTYWFRSLPEAILAAVVLVAVKGLIDLAELRHLWHVSRLDFAAASVAFGGVLLMGVLDGVLIAVLASIVMLLARASRPYVAFLGRIPGTNRFSDLARHASNELIPATIIFRVQSSLLYFNVDRVLEEVRGAVQARSDVDLVVADLSNAPYADVAGARMLSKLHAELRLRGVALKLVEAHGPVREILRAERLEDLVGPITRLESLHQLLADRLSNANQRSGNPVSDNPT